MKDIHAFEPLWGTWRVDQPLGSGSFGTVWRASRTEFGQTYLAAIKHISVPQNESELAGLYEEGIVTDDLSVTGYYDAIVSSLVAEINTMYALQGHTNIVSYEDHLVIPKEGMPGYDLFIRMELLRSVAQMMSQKQFTEAETAKLGMDIASALTVLEKHKLIHRDIKPQNIFVNNTGDYKLGDFGTARQLERTSSVMSKKGTYNYMAPELYKGEAANKTVDIYSLGLVMYRMLNKNRAPLLPLDTRAISLDESERALTRRMAGDELPPPVNASPEMAKIILKACASRPQDRYQSGEELRGALIALIGGASIDQTTPLSFTKASDQPAQGPADNPQPQPQPNPVSEDGAQQNSAFLNMAEQRKEKTIPIFGFSDNEGEAPKDKTVPSDDYEKHMQEKRQEAEKKRREEEEKRREAERQEAERQEAAQREAERKAANKKKLIYAVAVIAALAIVAFFLLYGKSGNGAASPTPTPYVQKSTPTPTKAPSKTPIPWSATDLMPEGVSVAAADAPGRLS